MKSKSSGVDFPALLFWFLHGRSGHGRSGHEYVEAVHNPELQLLCDGGHLEHGEPFWNGFTPGVIL